MDKNHAGLLKVEQSVIGLPKGTRSITWLKTVPVPYSASGHLASLWLTGQSIERKMTEDAVHLLGSRHTWWFFCHQGWFWWCQSLFAAGRLLDPSNLWNRQERTCTLKFTSVIASHVMTLTAFIECPSLTHGSEISSTFWVFLRSCWI